MPLVCLKDRIPVNISRIKAKRNTKFSTGKKTTLRNIEGEITLKEKLFWMTMPDVLFICEAKNYSCSSALSKYQMLLSVIRYITSQCLT